MPSELWIVLVYALAVAVKVLVPEHPSNKLTKLLLAEADLVSHVIRLPAETVSRVDAPHWRVDPPQTVPKPARDDTRETLLLSNHLQCVATGCSKDQIEIEVYG